MEFNLKIKMDNAAFSDYPASEVTRILHTLVNDLESGRLSIEDKINLRDFNGNLVGVCEVEN